MLLYIMWKKCIRSKLQCIKPGFLSFKSQTEGFIHSSSVDLHSSFYWGVVQFPALHCSDMLCKSLCQLASPKEHPATGFWEDFKQGCSLVVYKSCNFFFNEKLTLGCPLIAGKPLHCEVIYMPTEDFKLQRILTHLLIFKFHSKLPDTSSHTYIHLAYLTGNQYLDMTLAASNSYLEQSFKADVQYLDKSIIFPNSATF